VRVSSWRVADIDVRNELAIDAPPVRRALK